MLNEALLRRMPLRKEEEKEFEPFQFVSSISGRLRVQFLRISHFMSCVSSQDTLIAGIKPSRPSSFFIAGRKLVGKV